jgi:hypothetical protein
MNSRERPHALASLAYLLFEHEKRKKEKRKGLNG